MADFKVKIGNEMVTVKVILKSMLCVIYKRKEYFIEPVNNGKKITWKHFAGKLDNKLVQQIGKAIVRGFFYKIPLREYNGLTTSLLIRYMRRL